MTFVTQNKASLDLVLRRVDWRFLLSNPTPVKSIVFGDGLLREAVEFVSGSTANNRSNYTDLNCDLAVAVDPDDKTLEECFLSLEPGGECYIEWNNCSLLRVEQIKKKLKHTGFNDITYYLPQSNPAQSPSNVWIPLGNPRVINYWHRSALNYKQFFKNSSLNKSLKKFIWIMMPNVFTNYLWFSYSYLRRFTICSIASKPMSYMTNSKFLNVVEQNKNGSNDNESKNKLRNIIQSCWDIKGSKNNSNNTSILMITEGKFSYKKTLLLIFGEQDSTPSFVLKMPRTNAAALLLETEAQVLQMLEEKYAGIDGIPKILLSNYNAGYYTVGETFIDGTNLSNRITRNNYRDLAHKVTSWLIVLAMKTKTTNNLSVNPVNWILEQLSRFLCSDLYKELILQTHEILGNAKIPFLVCEHGDFSPGNILIDTNNNLGVIDWESAQFSGLPLEDLIYFLTRMNFHLDNAWNTGKFRESYRNILNESTMPGTVFKECINLYASKLGIPYEETHSFRLITLLSHLLVDIDDRRLVPVDPGTKQTSIYIDLWEEELNYIRKKL